MVDEEMILRDLKEAIKSLKNLEEVLERDGEVAKGYALEKLDLAKTSIMWVERIIDPSP